MSANISKTKTSLKNANNSKKKNNNSSQNINLSDIIKNLYYTSVDITFRNVTLKMEIGDNHIKFYYNMTECIEILVSPFRMLLQKFFYKADKYKCINKENKNLMLRNDKEIIDDSNNFFMSLIDNLAILLKCKKIVLDDISVFSNETCDLSGNIPFLLADMTPFYKRFGYLSYKTAEEENTIITDIIIPFRQIHISNLTTVEFINKEKNIKNPFYNFYKQEKSNNNLVNLTQDMAKSYLYDLLYIIETLNIKPPEDTIGNVYKILKEFCKNNKKISNLKKINFIRHGNCLKKILLHPDMLMSKYFIYENDIVKTYYMNKDTKLLELKTFIPENVTITKSKK